MTVALLDPEPEQAAAAEAMPGLRLIVLARIACDEGASRAELARELGPLLGPGANRLHIEVELAKLVRAGLSVELRGRFTASQAGLDWLLRDLGLKALPRTWLDLRDGRLVARALGMEREPAARIKSLGRPDVLREAILTRAYSLKLRGAGSSSKLRAALALAALERAFGNQIRSELSRTAGLKAKASRLLAGQLLRKPRDAGTDNRLIALLAAEAVDSAKLDADALRAALLRRLAASGARPTASQPVAPATPSLSPAAKRDAVTTASKGEAPPAAVAAGVPLAPRPAAASRPDLPGFVKIVHRFADALAEGWPGNRKALVSRIFKAIAAAHPAWGLTLVEFKAMLAECHRTGHLALSTADLKEKGRLEELRDSAIAYKNTVWHLVRVES